MNPVWSILVPAISGLVAGILGSLVAPWVQWGIEKKREKLRNRREIVAQCRSKVEADEFTKDSFTATQEYLYLKPYLSQNLVTAFEHENTFLVGNRSSDSSHPYRRALMEAVKQLEREWDLV